MQGLMQDWPLVVNKVLDHAAKFHCEQEVVTCTAEGPVHRCTYKEVHRRSQLCALGLQRLGVREGSVVATLAFNTYRHVETWYGIMGLGAVCHSLNVRLFKTDLEYIINHAEDYLIMLDPAYVDLMVQLQSKLPTVQGFIILTDRQHMPQHSKLNNMHCYEELLQAQMCSLPFQWQVQDEKLAASLCYTSGTTGKPKGVLYSHRSHFLHALACSTKHVADFGSKSCFLCMVPMFHANAAGTIFTAPMTGAKLILPGSRLDGRSVYTALEEFKCDSTSGVPTVVLGLLDYMTAENKQLHHLKMVRIGGAACPLKIVTKFSSMGIEVRQSWGMTETSPICSTSGVKGSQGSLSKQEEARCRLSQGWPHLLTDMRMVNADGKELPRDGKSTGELQVQGPHVIQSYFRAPNKAVDKEGWFSTGDVASIDPLGFMRITDRLKDIIKSGGEWISSIELENMAMSHDKVAEAAVIAVPHPKWNERPLLIVVPVVGSLLTASDMLSFLKGHVAKWWVPEDVLFVKSIPHTATGKINKLLLRQHFEKDKLTTLSRL